jgi:hypothetical protein
VGRGGVLDLAAGQVDPAAHVVLDAVHRFIRTDEAGRTVPDTEYAELTLAMRTGADPGAVFDALAARGRIRLHADTAARQEALAATATTCYGAGEPVAVVVDTREQAAELGAAIRNRLVAGGRVEDTRAVTTGSGQRIGVGDRVATRRNNPGLRVANRENWTVTAVDRDGRLTVTPTTGNATPAGVAQSPGRQRVLPADYVTSDVELAYVSTAHGVQGDTVPAAHVVIGEHTGAASAYVGMTRGRTANTAHLIAAHLAQARQQWIAVFSRDRADLGPRHAAELAAAETARYATPRPLEEVLAELQQAWTVEQRCLDRLALQQPLRDGLRAVVALEADQADRLAALQEASHRAAADARRARQQAERSRAVLDAEAGRIRDALLADWNAERPAAQQAARTVLDGPGRLGLRRPAVARAAQQLTDWADRWHPHLPDLPADTHHLAQVAGRFDDRPVLRAAFDAAAHRAAEAAHPEHAALHTAADATAHAHEQAQGALAEARRRRDDQLAPFGALGRTPDRAARLAELDRDIATTKDELSAAQAHVGQLSAAPAILAQPADRLAQERAVWRVRRDAERAARRAAAAAASSLRATGSLRPPEPATHETSSPGTYHGIWR